MKIVYEIRYGRKAMMYTLWRVGLPDAHERYFETYVKNLSTDFETAFQKANERAKLNGFEVVIDAPESLRDIVRGEDVIRWGKYCDTRVSDIDDDKYLIWLFKGAFYKNIDGDWNNKLYKNDPIRIAAENVLLSKGLLVEYNDRIVTIEKYEELKRLEELNSNSDYIGEVGDKIEVKVKIEKIICFDGFYGTIWLTTMRTSEGNVVVYKGKSLDKIVWYKDLLTNKKYSDSDKKFWKNLIHIGVEDGRYHTLHDSYKVTREQMETICNFDFQGKNASHIDVTSWKFYDLERMNDSYLHEGDEITIKGIVKEHSDYKGTRQTILQRVSVVL